MVHTTFDNGRYLLQHVDNCAKCLIYTCNSTNCLRIKYEVRKLGNDSEMFYTKHVKTIPWQCVEQ